MEFLFIFLFSFGIICYNLWQLQKQIPWVKNIVGIIIAVLLILGTKEMLDRDQAARQRAVDTHRELYPYK